MPDAKKLDACLNGNSILGPLIQQAELASRVNETLRRQIQAPWIRHVRFIRLNGDTAVVSVSSAAAMTSLRFQLNLLQRALADALSTPQLAAAAAAAAALVTVSRRRARPR